MDRFFQLAEGLIPKNYSQQAEQANRSRDRLFESLLSQRRIPEAGWEDVTIEELMQKIAMMDSNNFIGNVGVGEREARVYSGIVARRHFRMAHGVGRSGDVSAPQPKAAGGSLIVALANRMAAEALALAGFSECRACVILPLATGMALTMSLLSLKKTRRSGRFVVWPRVDQKTCFKSISAAGLEVLVVPNVLIKDELRTDMAELEKAMALHGPEAVLCVISTTSCFAPRAPDRVVKIGKLCKKYEVPHVVNNAYGVQSSVTMAKISKACRRGRVDVVVQSTDKNFMVPVGGSILASPSKGPIEAINALYPGRASAAPATDLFITFLSMGTSGFRGLLRERDALLPYMRDALAQLAARYGERVLATPHNPISLAITVDTFDTFLGSMLFSRCVSGTRVVCRGKTQHIDGTTFTNYGAHCDEPRNNYLSAACAIGIRKADIDTFIKRLDGAMAHHRRKILNSSATRPHSSGAIDTAGHATDHLVAADDNATQVFEGQNVQRQSDLSPPLSEHTPPTGLCLEQRGEI